MTNTVMGKRAQFIDALLAGESVPSAAASVNRSTRTGYRWLEVPDVRRALGKAQDARFALLAARLFTLSNSALRAVATVLQDSNAPAYVKLSAAKLVLDSLLSWRSSVVLADRVAVLEEAELERASTQELMRGR